jgi:hypothetical protein
MKRSRFARLWRHPGTAIIGTMLFGFTTAIAAYKAVVVEQIIVTGDPVQIVEYNVDQALTPSVAIDQIDDALSKGDPDIAEGFVALAAELNVASTRLIQPPSSRPPSPAPIRTKNRALSSPRQI